MGLPLDVAVRRMPPMTTIFTIPKPFEGRMAVIQHNAIQSWLRVMDCEVLLVGNETGVGEYASKHGLGHIPSVRCTENGTPLIDDVWQKAREAAAGDLLAYLNCDIMFTTSLTGVAKKIPFDSYLGICRRWDVEMDGEWDFSEGWQQRLEDYARRNGNLRHGRAVECHFFPKHTGFGEMLPFAVGRNRYDNWIVLRALELGIPVIDMTPIFPVVHQNHERHVPALSDEAYRAEIRTNHQLAGGFKRLATSHDATHTFGAEGLKPNGTSVAARFYRSFRKLCQVLDV